MHEMSNDDYLATSWYIDHGHPEVTNYAHSVCCGANTPKDMAIRLYYAVRDDIIYNPYLICSNPELFKASSVLEKRAGFCVTKAVLYAACARAVGIPARLGFADVQNHLNSENLQEAMGTDLFAYHGYNEINIEGRWISITPTFNRALCERLGVKVLEFDGENDALFHPFDLEGKEHMEYVRYHGTFADLPLEMLLAAWSEHYPRMMGA